MKQIIFIYLILFPFLSISQDFRYTLNDKGKAEYNEVVNAYPIKAEDLKVNAIKWAKLQYFNKYYSDSDNKIIVTGSIPVSKSSVFGSIDMGVFNYTLIIEVKDNKFRYTITEIEHKGKFKDMEHLAEAAGSKRQQKTWDEMKRTFEEKILNYAAGLKFHMNTKPVKEIAW